jgi:hypothetical protein
MKSLLDGRPTLSDLTGISASRLDAFASHLHNYLLTSSTGDVKSLGSLNESASTSREHDLYLHPHSAVSKASRFLASPINATKVSSVHQMRLSPRSSTFKDGVTRTSGTKLVGKEKLKRLGEWSGMSTVPTHANPIIPDTVNIKATCERRGADCARSIPLDLTLPFPSLPSMYPLTTCPLPEAYSEKQFKPYYCWCPPGPSVQYSVTSLHLPATSVEPLPLPPLSALLSNELPSSSAFSAKLDTTDLPSLNLPSILHDPLLHLPLHTSPLVPIHGSQVPMFTPLMSDTIVHIPVIDVCSTDQAYLVSCGPSISSTVPLLPCLNPLLPEAESLVERSARETLMRLIASTPSANSAQLANIFPVVVSGFPESIPRVHNVSQRVMQFNSAQVSVMWLICVCFAGEQECCCYRLLC